MWTGTGTQQNMSAARTPARHLAEFGQGGHLGQRAQTHVDQTEVLEFGEVAGETFQVAIGGAAVVQNQLQNLREAHREGSDSRHRPGVRTGFTSSFTPALITRRDAGACARARARNLL